MEKFEQSLNILKTKLEEFDINELGEGVLSDLLDIGNVMVRHRVPNIVDRYDAKFSDIHYDYLRSHISGGYEYPLDIMEAVSNLEEFYIIWNKEFIDNNFA